MRLKVIIASALILGALLFWYSHAHANPDSNPTNPIDSLNPTSGTYGSVAYPGQLYNFLAKEDANRYLEQGFGNFVVSGCLGIVSAGLVMTPSSCIAYNAGFRSTETGAITFASGQTYWVAMDENTSGSNAGLTNFTRAGATHYLIDNVDVTQPAMPNDAQLLMKVTTLAGAITAVTDLRVLTPNFALAVTTLHANLNANGFRITALGAPAATGDALSEGAAVGAKTPAAGTFTNVTDSALTSGQCVQAGTGGLLAVTGSACASAVPNGNAPQILGYAAANTPEAETVSGDFAFTRAGANSYTAAVTKVNGNAVSSTAPTAAQVWVENAGATSMVPVSISGDCTIAATGAITCTKINGTTPGGTCTNQFVTAINGSAVPTCTTATLASAQFANQGTTTTLLHGNGAGNPSFAGVSLANDTAANQGSTTTVLHGNAAGQPSFTSVTNSDFGTQTANTVLAGPTSGSVATPSFRALVNADIPVTTGWDTPDCNTRVTNAGMASNQTVLQCWYTSGFTATNISLNVTTADNSANVYDWGVYNSAGTMLVDTGGITGSVGLASTGVKTFAIIINSACTGANAPSKCCTGAGTGTCPASAPVTIPAGLICTAVTGNAAVITTNGCFSAATSAPVNFGETTSGGATTSGKLSTSITAPSGRTSVFNYQFLHLD